MVKFQNLFILALVIVAIVLGSAIYKQKVSQKTPEQTNTNTQVSQPLSSGPGTASVSGQRRPLPTDLTDDEKALLSPPNQDSPKEDKDKHYAIVVKLAQDASVLDLNNCQKPSPLDMRVKDKSTFKIKNSDSVDHTVVIDQNHHYSVSANSDTSVTVDFGHGLGAYGYLCDNQPGVVGFFLVSP